jgi:hypothetical protein
MPETHGVAPTGHMIEIGIGIKGTIYRAPTGQIV